MFIETHRQKWYISIAHLHQFNNYLCNLDDGPILGKSRTVILCKYTLLQIGAKGRSVFYIIEIDRSIDRRIFMKGKDTKSI